MNRTNLLLAAAPLRCGRLRDFIFSFVALLFSVPSSAQTMDSTDLPVLWLRADRCSVSDTAWKDVTGHGYDGSFFGQAKNLERYAARQAEHARANPKADFEFEIIDRGREGRDLDLKEQKHIDARGGVTNKSNPNGGLSNRNNVIKKVKK